MVSLTSRPYADAEDLASLLRFSEQAVGARWPLMSYMKPGDVVWDMPGSDPRANIHLWFDGSDLVAYACFDPPLHASFDIAPGYSRFDSVGDEVLKWMEQRRRGLLQEDEAIPKAYAMLGHETVSTTALSGDRERIALLARHGYTVAVDRYQAHHSLSLIEEPIEVPPLADGLRLRHATDADIEERVGVHRDAWSVWGPSSATPETYRRLRAAPVYDETLDVVLEDSTGKFLSYCIGWLDLANRVGHFEPVGCRPAHTGKGYARAVIIEGLRRMQSRGMHTALVATESVNPRARATYLSCGFVEVERANYYVKKI